MKCETHVRLVVMVVANIKQFRRAFYLGLAKVLSEYNIELRVIYSDPSFAEKSKYDSIELMPPLGHKVPFNYFLGERLLWQHLPFRILKQADLIIIVQANGYLSNYPLLLARALKLKKVAFWGHGYNHQGHHQIIREVIKRWFARQVDWWFTYTERTATYLVDIGMPENRITVIQNAIDTRDFAKNICNFSDDKAKSLRGTLGIAQGDYVALYCGSLYPGKHIPFLLETADLLRARLPSFHLVVIGAGPDALRLESAATRPWLHYIGPCFGEEKVGYFRISDIILNPGIVGLGILDCFAAGRPLITCDIPIHSPEIAYLEHDVNGLMCPFNMKSYSDMVFNLLTDSDRLNLLQTNASAAAEQYSVENMIDRVREGILHFFESGKL